MKSNRYSVHDSDDEMLLQMGMERMLPEKVSSHEQERPPRKDERLGWIGKKDGWQGGCGQGCSLASWLGKKWSEP
ncbi:uncharacterized [Tachysurus ichikawai]